MKEGQDDVDQETAINEQVNHEAYHILANDLEAGLVRNEYGGIDQQQHHV